MWYQRVIGGERCPIVDTWWQTETGGHMISPVPGAVATKPGSCTLPLPGIMADMVDEHGNAISEAIAAETWSSRTVAIDDAHDLGRRRALPQDLSGASSGAATTSPGIQRPQATTDGYFWIMGRIDDVLNVSGHRLGTMEIESALVAHPLVAEAAVVGKPHDIKGESIVAFVVSRAIARPAMTAEAMIRTLRDWVAEANRPDRQAR